MPRLSLDTAVSRIAADQIISRKELADTADLAAVRDDPQGLIDRLTPVAGQMTGRAADAFEGFKAAVAAGNPDAVANLQKESLDAPKLPAWMPAQFDMNKAVDGAKQMLIAQGEPAASIGPGLANRVVFTDVDLTLLKTDTPTLLKHKVTGQYLHDPGTGKLLLLRDLGPELAALKAKYPAFNFDDYAPDFREFGSVAELLRMNAIPEDLRILKKSDADAKSRDFVITARSDDIMIDALDLLLTQKGVDINGVFAVNGPTAVSTLGMADTNANPTANPPVPAAWSLKSNQRKAVSMAAVLLAYGGQDHVKNVRFMDDGDDNLQAAMDLLPKMFPKIAFEFYDVEHKGRNHFKQRLIAKSGAGGELLDARSRKPFSVDAIKTYADNDLPIGYDPRLYPSHVGP
jgi:hypothetical protein